MATASVRKFGISLDPDEVVDFAEGLEWFSAIFSELGFEQVGIYTWRHKDAECMIKAELTRSPDGYYLWAMVQAQDEHIFRLSELADAFGGHVVEPSKRAS